uniref:Uncharacterized protein n=1 Tax=Kalanchoe fedtschenkoi TaxID=63787 RepID=A0A7N0UQF0_KALFE
MLSNTRTPVSSPQTLTEKDGDAARAASTEDRQPCQYQKLYRYRFCFRRRASDSKQGNLHYGTRIRRPGRSAVPAAGLATIHRHIAGNSTAALIHLGNDGVAYPLQLLQLVLQLIHLRQLVLVQPLDRFIHRLLDPLLVCRVELPANLLILDSVSHVVSVVLQPVLGLHLLLHLLILRLVLLRLLHHLLDLLLAQPPLVVRDSDLVLHPSRLVLSGHVEDAVGVDVEAHIDLGHASRGRRDAVIVLSSRSLPFIHLDQHARLVVRISREDLLFFGRDRRIPRDQHRHHPASRLEPEAQRGDIDQDRGLDRCTVGHRLVGVDALAKLLPVEEILQELLDFRDPGRSPDKDHLVHAAFVDLGITETFLHGLHAPPEQVHVQLLEPGSSDGRVKVDSLVERVDFDGGLSGGGECALGSLASGSEAAQRPGVPADVLLVLSFELRHEVVHQPVVEILAAQMGVSGRGLHFENPLLDRQQRDVERASAEVEDEHVLLAFTRRFLVQPVRDRGSGRLVDDPHDVQPGDDSGVLRRLPLRVVEVGRDSDHRVFDRLAEVGFSDLPHLRQHHRAYLLGGEHLLLALVLHHDHRLVARPGNNLERPVLHVALHRGVGELPPDQPLRVEHGVVRVHGDLVLRRVADQTLRVGEGHVGGRGAVALVVGDDLHPVVLPHAHAAVRRAEIDPDSLSFSFRHFSRLRKITKASNFFLSL